MTDILTAIEEALEGMKYEDPRTSKHHAPIGQWTDCEACKENYTHNAAIDQALTTIRRIINNEV